MIGKIGVLSSPESWFGDYALQLVELIRRRGFDCSLYTSHEDILEEHAVLFILSYFRLIPRNFLARNRFNIVVHESDLPSGKGWAPLFWQILEGKNRIPVILFEAVEKTDAGDIYLKDYIELSGLELHNEIRNKQALKTIDMCLHFLDEGDRLRPVPQAGETSFFKKRTAEDSELDVNKTIDEQFNLLRIVNNDDYPAFFYIEGKKYILKIYDSPVNSKYKCNK